MIKQTCSGADVLAVTGGTRAISDADHVFHAEIGLNEDVFQILQHVLIEHSLGEDTARWNRQAAASATEFLSQAFEPGKPFFPAQRDWFVGLLFLYSPADGHFGCDCFAGAASSSATSSIEASGAGIATASISISSIRQVNSFSGDFRRRFKGRFVFRSSSSQALLVVRIVRIQPMRSEPLELELLPLRSRSRPSAGQQLQRRFPATLQGSVSSSGAIVFGRLCWWCVCVCKFDLLQLYSSSREGRVDIGQQIRFQHRLVDSCWRAVITARSSTRSSATTSGSSVTGSASSAAVFSSMLLDRWESFRSGSGRLPRRGPLRPLLLAEGNLLR